MLLSVLDGIALTLLSAGINGAWWMLFCQMQAIPSMLSPFRLIFLFVPSVLVTMILLASEAIPWHKTIAIIGTGCFLLLVGTIQSFFL